MDMLGKLALFLTALAEAQKVIGLCMVRCRRDELMAKPAHRTILIDDLRFRAIGPDHKETVSGRVLQLGNHFFGGKPLLCFPALQADAYMSDVVMAVVMGWLFLNADNPFSAHSVLRSRCQVKL